MQSVSTTISFTQNQVDEFGRLTGDYGPVHSIDGLVQGSLIVGSLPSIFGQLMVERNILTGYTHNVGMIIEAKFRKKLYTNTPVTLEFNYKTLETNNLNLKWKIFSDQILYCNGTWVIRKSKS